MTRRVRLHIHPQQERHPASNAQNVLLLQHTAPSTLNAHCPFKGNGRVDDHHDGRYSQHCREQIQTQNKQPGHIVAHVNGHSHPH